eukprot:5697051-Prymnesium_polylepis.1
MTLTMPLRTWSSSHLLRATPGQAGLHADSKAYASFVRVARPWAAALKMSAKAAAPQHRRRGRPSAPAAPREPP